MDIEILVKNATASFAPKPQDISDLIGLVLTHYPPIDGRPVFRVELAQEFQFFRSKGKRLLPIKPLSVSVFCKYVKGKTAILPSFGDFTKQAEEINKSIQSMITGGDDQKTLHLPAQVSISAGKIYRFVSFSGVEVFTTKEIM